jgi:hypothetical protein
VADTVTTCPKCGNLLAVDSYGATSFAPVLPPPQQVAVRQTEQLGTAATVMSMSSPVPPTMTSNSPRPQPAFVITPAPMPQYGGVPPTTPKAYAPTMQSAIPTPPPQMAPPTPHSGPSNALAPYAPPPPYGMYPMMQPPMSMQPMSQQGTPGLAVAALICGLLGWIPFWIGFILCILAIIFASIVLSSTPSGRPGRGLAITGLVFGLVLLLPAACGL